jgi:L,D-peptidoglycan transpeptidase YkuD (ErfK/YbiS/YcfS/YnhG family)
MVAEHDWDAEIINIKLRKSGINNRYFEVKPWILFAFRSFPPQFKQMRFLVIFLCVACILPATAFELPERSGQCILGVADGWNSSHVTLSYHEKKDGKWVPVGEAWKGRLGSKGLVWGRGIHPNPRGANVKKEGDGRAPAGVFNLGGVWGVDKQVKKHPKTFYHQVTPRDLWVEDPSSKYYNQFLSLNREPKTEWEKKAQMRQNDYPHSLKMFIAHNAFPDIEKGAGSSIFFHIWRRGGAAATAGCTTMEEEKLRWLIATVDPALRPLYVLLPRSEYEKLKSDWKLP